MSHKTYITCADRPFNTMGAETLRGFFFSDTKPCCSCLAVFHSGQDEGRDRSRGWRHRFKLHFWDKECFCSVVHAGQSHGEASGPKVSLSIIPILHCKQSGCLLPRFVPDAEKSSSSAADQIISVVKWQTEIASRTHRFQLRVWPLPHHAFPKISPLLKNSCEISERGAARCMVCVSELQEQMFPHRTARVPDGML